MTQPECTCHATHEPPWWHNHDCPVLKLGCESCDGKGYHVVQLSCECCSDTEICEECKGTGFEKVQG
jgi:hypothetical protein